MGLGVSMVMRRQTVKAPQPPAQPAAEAAPAPDSAQIAASQLHVRRSSAPVPSRAIVWRRPAVWRINLNAGPTTRTNPPGW